MHYAPFVVHFQGSNQGHGLPGRHLFNLSESRKPPDLIDRNHLKNQIRLIETWLTHENQYPLRLLDSLLMSVVDLKKQTVLFAICLMVSPILTEINQCYIIIQLIHENTLTIDTRIIPFI